MMKTKLGIFPLGDALRRMLGSLSSMFKIPVNGYEKSYYKIHDLYLRVTSGQTGSRLIIALRCYKNQNGHRPERLEDIKPLTPAEIFIDPINNGSFVYKLTDDSFKLYSKGKNNIDDGGKRDKGNEEKTGTDDWLIWPKTGKKCKIKKENTNTEQQ